MRKKVILPVLVLVGLVLALIRFLAFYNPTRTVTPEEFLAAARPDYHNTIITVSYYCGSKEGFDYFVVIPPWGKEQRYRLSDTNSFVRQRFTLSTERSQWPSFD